MVSHQLRFWAICGFVLLIVLAPATAMLRAADSSRPMQSHLFADVPVAGQEFMEPYINAFYHQGVTGGCGVSPMQYCPTNPVTRGSMAVFVGRALGYVEAVTDGYPTRAYFKNTSGGYGAIGSSEDEFGLWGMSVNNDGVHGSSEHGYGVSAESENGTALLADGGVDFLFDSIADIQLAGSYGELKASTLVLSGANIVLDINHVGANPSTVVLLNSDDAVTFEVNEDGDIFAMGDLDVRGTKSSIADTVSYGTRALYAIESPEVWFEDFGSAELVNGEVVISLDPMFAETVNLNEDYRVFLTPVDGWAELYVTQKTATSFTVRATDPTASLLFDYRIVAKRLGYENTRLEEVGD